MPRIVRAANGAPGGGQYPSYASDSPSAFIPQMWSPLMVEQYYAATVVADISNTNYAGEITGYGDSVIIRLSPDVNISDHEVGEDIWDKYEVPESGTILLEINKSKMFAIQIDSIDELQSDIALENSFAKTAGMKMAQSMDVTMLLEYSDGAAAENKGATAGAISGDIDLGAAGAPVLLNKDSIVEYILNLALVLDEQDVPRDERFLIMPSRFMQIAKNSELKAAYLTGDERSTIRNGKVGMIDDFMVYGSNLLPRTGTGATAEARIIAGHKDALTFAAQIDPHSLEVMPNPRKFGKLMRGLNLYGNQVIKPEALANGVVRAG